MRFKFAVIALSFSLAFLIPFTSYADRMVLLATGMLGLGAILHRRLHPVKVYA